MKYLLIALTIVALSLFATGPALAMDGDMTCTHDMTTIQSLQECITHAIDMGHIDNAGIGQSLLAKVGAAQAALDRGQPGVAVNILQALVNEVNAQAGQHIDAMHAEHMVMHAGMVIDALSSAPM